MNIESIKALLTSPLVTGGIARAVNKVALIVGGGAIAASSDKTQIVSAIVTLVLFCIELWQSRIAHKRALMTPPPA